MLADLRNFLSDFEAGNGQMFKLRIARHEETDEICNFLFVHFFSTSPNLEICYFDDPKSAENMKRFITREVGKAINQGISIVVRDSANHLAGVRINKLARKTDSAGPGTNELTNTLIGSLLGALNENVDVHTQYETDTVLALFLMGVDQKYGGLGLAKKMVEVSLELGAAAGAGAAKAEAVNTYAVKALAKHGFETLKTIDYVTFEHENDTPLARAESLLSEHSKACLMVRRLP